MLPVNNQARRIRSGPDSGIIHRIQNAPNGDKGVSDASSWTSVFGTVQNEPLEPIALMLPNRP